MYKTKSVKAQMESFQTRASIKVQVKFAGKVYQTVVSLTNRSDMKYPMLIGRKF